MERETGLEPATSSLGRWTNVENKRQLRLLRCVPTNQIRRVFRNSLDLSSNGVNGVKPVSASKSTLTRSSDPLWIAFPPPCAVAKGRPDVTPEFSVPVADRRRYSSGPLPRSNRFTTEAQARRAGSANSPTTGGSEPNPLLQLAAIRALRAPGPSASQGSSPVRTAEWQVRPAGHRSS